MSLSAPRPLARRRLRLELAGAVQGVGMRPFVYRLARELGLSGWVSNGPAGVLIEAEGPTEALARFRERLRRSPPPAARIEACLTTEIAPEGGDGFAIRDSRGGAAIATQALPDLAICADCLAELNDPADRRYRYPFINCTQCGPRWSILRGLPYDRARTTMVSFALCAACEAEYRDPSSRRFHAQPVACADCGPQLALWDGGGRVLAAREAALAGAVAALRRGEIVALKGLGGFQLLVDAADADAVARLRERKRRPHKPFALMTPDLRTLEALVEADAAAHELLSSPAAPIVLLRRRPGAPVAEAVAPSNPYLGVMMPTTPLHHLLLRAFGAALVATSGNLSDEPLCIDEREALARLGGTADLFLVHDRPIQHPVDDSVVQLVDGVPMLLRRARGYAPRPVGEAAPRPVLAVGGQLKNTVALGCEAGVVLGPHVGDLGSPAARAAFESGIAALEDVYRATLVVVAHDTHPDYASSLYAQQRGLPRAPVQHHHAHAAALLLEHGLRGPLLVAVWDGSGLGGDGGLWGGEFLLAERARFQRQAWLRPFPLPGGERAMREPRRCVLGLLHAAGEDAGDVGADSGVLQRMLERRLNCPATTSVGRLFDAVAALLGFDEEQSFEGQAAMALQYLAEQFQAPVAPYPLPLIDHALDWAPMLRALRADLSAGAEPALLAARFHETLAAAAVTVALALAQRAIGFTGGCFQNRLLLTRCLERARAAGLAVYPPRSIPPNDGGLAAGQAAVAMARSTPACV